MRMIIDGRQPTAPAMAAGPTLAPVRKASAGWYETTDGAWEIVWALGGSVPWRATLKATGQSLYRPTLGACQAAIASGDATTDLAAADTAALAQPCRACGAPAAGLVDTINGPQPICAGCTPGATAHGRTVRTPASEPCTVCGASGAGGECAACTRRHDHLVDRSTDI